MDINKDLVAASATPLVLAILAEAESYGYAILKRVGELSGGALQWTDGMLYPVLHRLERQGHIQGKWGTSETGRKRKYYHLTPQGRAQLVEQRQQWQAVDAALRNIWLAVAVPAVQPAAERHRLWQSLDAALRSLRDTLVPPAGWSLQPLPAHV